jgi:hypothetical protein
VKHLREISMPNINRTSSKHNSPWVTQDGKNKWEPFTDDKTINVMIAAFMEINKRIIDSKGVLKTCNRAFAKLPGARNFAAVWRDPAIWVSFNPNPEDGLFGITYKKDIAIAAHLFTLIEPARFIAATLVHELAHVNGAPGGQGHKEAEATLPPCGFDDLYNSAIEGKVLRPQTVYMA